jgi:long-chain acyl-CoA synthetase
MTLFKNLEEFKNKKALLSKTIGSITYKDLVRFAYRHKKIFPKRAFIILISDNSISALLYYISAIRNNFIVMMVDIKTPEKEMINLIDLYKPAFVVGPTKVIEKSKLNLNDRFDKNYEYSTYKTGYKNNNKINKSISLLLPTSGSMGSPKFVKLTKANLKFNSEAIIKYLNIRGSDRAITTMPLSYSYMISIINTHLDKGSSIYVTNHSIMQKEFWSIYKKNKITSLSGVPYMYKIFLKLGLKNLYTKSLKIFTQAGGNLDKNSTSIMINFCKKNKIKFIPMYGQTEASPRISYLDWRYVKKKIGSIGKNIHGTKMWIENEDGKKIKETNVVGEIVFKGKNVFMGYCESPNDLIKGNEKNGVLKTGDLAHIDKDGFFFIEGRKVRIAKVFGIRISLDELEEKIKDIGYDVVCKNFNDKITIYYLKGQNIEKNLSKISNITGLSKLAFHFISLAEFPRTAVGKINHAKLNILN